ncbi:hypothetical protein TWF970_002356 [Orbilia oligospora]|uniref:Uncharacterized protein n=1 Tax=Orbilia oligospora TaxID=2813651 RepID=A0A7C8RIA1_ORBOL|nr:hypothetical protein TWF970_002356 [Orbilia oligospora]
MASGATIPSNSFHMAHIMSKSVNPDISRQPFGTPGLAPPSTPSKIPLPPTPTSPVSLKGQLIGTPIESQERSGLKTSTTASSLAGISSQATAGTTSGFSLPSQSNGFPSLVFPPTTQQAYHTRNLLLHIYSMFNGAQAAIHQLGANCEFNQNLITFLSGQLVEKDRKIQTLTASVNMLQTAVQRAMKNNEELKKNEEGLQEEIKALQSNNGSDAGNMSKEQEAELTAKIEKLSRALDIQAQEKVRMSSEHSKKLGGLEKEVDDLKETIEILEESLRYAVSLRFDEMDFDETGEVINNENEHLRNDEDRAEKMMNGRLEDASAGSDDSLIDEVNGVTHANGEHIIFTDGASNGGYLSLGPGGRPIYLDSIMEEPEEEAREESMAMTIAKFPIPPCSPPAGVPQAPGPAIDCNAPINVTTSRGVTKLRATAKPFVNEMEYHYVNDENMKASSDEADGPAMFL